MNAVFAALALIPLLAVPVWADMVGTGETLVENMEGSLPLVLVVLLLIATALLVRKLTKKK